MAPQAHSLLVHGDLVGKYSRLRQYPALVDGGGLQHLPHLRLQPCPIFGHSLGRAFLHLGHHGLNGVSSSGNVLAELFALHAAHLPVGGQRLLQHGADVGGDHLQILLLLGHRQHIGKFCQSHRGQIVRQHEHLLQPAQRLIIAPGQRLIHLHNRLIRLHGVHGDEHIHLAAGDRLLHQRLHGVLGKNIRSRHFHRAVQIAVVDRPHLHRDASSVALLPRAAITGHTLDHFSIPPLSCQQQ